MTQTSEPEPATAAADTAVWIDLNKESTSLIGRLTAWIPLLRETSSQLDYRGEYLLADLLSEAAGELERTLLKLTAPREPGVRPIIRLPLLRETAAIARTAALSLTWLGIARNRFALQVTANELQRLVGRYEGLIGERRCCTPSGSS